jgi:hypothetical protein
MKRQGFEARFSQNLAPVSREKPQNPYLAYISHLFSQPYLEALDLKKQLLGDNHPHTQTFYRNYLMMLSQLPEAELRQRFPEEVVEMLKPKPPHPGKQLLGRLLQGVLILLILPFYSLWLGLRWLLRRLGF